MRGRQDRADPSVKTAPIDFVHKLIDFAYKLAVAKGGARCQSVVRLHSTIRMAYLQATVLLKFVLMYFWRGGLFRNDKDAHSLVELGAPFSVRGGIVRR